MYMETKTLTCGLCGLEVTIHADGSAYCGCDARKVGDGKKLPVGWHGDRECFRAYMRYVRKL